MTNRQAVLLGTALLFTGIGLAALAGYKFLKGLLR